jgi:hypothetical protein
MGSGILRALGTDQMQLDRSRGKPPYKVLKRHSFKIQFSVHHFPEFLLHAINIETKMLGRSTRMAAGAAASNSEIYDAACEKWGLTRVQQLRDVKYVELGAFKPP